MYYLIIFFFIFIMLPIVPYVVVSYAFKLKLKLRFYYLIEGLIIFLILTLGHIYYEKKYNLSILPTRDYMGFVTNIAFITFIVFLVFGLIYRLVKKESWLSFKVMVITFIIFIVLFNWFIPLGHKYNYVKRIDRIDKMFIEEDADHVAVEGEIMIGLAESSVDVLTQPRYRSATFNNYFYIKNNGNDLYKGFIYLLLYDEDGTPLEVKLFENVEVSPNETVLLVEQDANKVIAGDWDYRSFGTKQMVKSFQVIIEK